MGLRARRLTHLTGTDEAPDPSGSGPHGVRARSAFEVMFWREGPGDHLESVGPGPSLG